MVNKKVVIIITILAIIVVALIIWYGVSLLQNTEYTFEEVSADGNLIDEEEIDDNTVLDEEETTTTDDSDDEDSLTDENTTSQQSTSSDTSSSDTASEDPEDVAKSFAEDAWAEEGLNQSVYYYVEEQLSDNVYVISVRSQDTTATLITYQVNIATGEVSEY